MDFIIENENDLEFILQSESTSGSSRFTEPEILRFIWSAVYSVDKLDCGAYTIGNDPTATSYCIVGGSDAITYGLRFIEWDFYATISVAFLVDGGSAFNVIRGNVGSWDVADKISTALWWLYSGKWDIYNYHAPHAYHPVFEGTALVQEGKSMEITAPLQYRIGELFETGITSAHDVIVYRQRSGKTNILRFEHGSLTAGTINSDGGIECGCTNYHYIMFSDYLEIHTVILSKKQIPWEDDAAEGEKTLLMYNDGILRSTCDIMDADGNLFFSKNANIADFM